MRSLFAGFTTRGKSFLAAGIAAVRSGLAWASASLVSLGSCCWSLPLLSALATGRARYRIQCSARSRPPRVPAGQTATVTMQLDNVSRLPTGLLLAEDTIPYSLGTRPRFVLDRIEPVAAAGSAYPLQSDRRGKFAIGPLKVRVADAFGLVELGRLVRPAEHARGHARRSRPLPWPALAGTWLGDGRRPGQHRGRGRRG